jgi:GDP-D-mannose dehydratase
VREVRPDECYNLGAQSHVAVSFKMPKCGSAAAARPLAHSGGHIGTKRV